VSNKPRKNTFREKVWKLMRIMGNYTLTDLTTLAECPYENISHYHQCLVKAGYARQTGTKRQEGRPGFDKIFRLVKNTGPKPPIQKELRFLFDQNTGEYWAEDPARVAEAIIHAGTQWDPGPATAITGKIKLGSGVKLLCPRKKNPPTPLIKGATDSTSPDKGRRGGVHVD